MTTLEQIAELLKPFATSSELKCNKHPETEAIMTCTGCGYGLCHDCIKLTASQGEIICQSCSALAKKKQAVGLGVKLLKLPATWVLLCVLISGLAYSCNFSNPSLAVMKQREAKRPWFQQQVGKLLLDKASRENQRAAALRILKKNEEAVTWSKRAALSFAKTAEYWHDTPIYATLKLGEARSILESGDPERALIMFKTIKVKPNSVISPSYNYYIGQAYEKNNDTQKAQKYFQQAMTAAEIVEKQQLDNLLDLETNDRRRGKVICSARIICGATLDVSDLTEKLEKYGIKPKPEPLFRGFKGLFSQGRRRRKTPESKQDDPFEPEKKAAPVEIEIEFNEQPAKVKPQDKDDFSVDFFN